MRDVRPGKDYKLDQGARRLLHDLRHKTSREVALEHKAAKEGKQEAAGRAVKEKMQWLAGDAVLLGYPLDYDPASDKRSIWPHTDDPETYCNFCKTHGCRAPKSKEQ